MLLVTDRICLRDDTMVSDNDVTIKTTAITTVTFFIKAMPVGALNN
jgi:hypothetical protein